MAVWVIPLIARRQASWTEVLGVRAIASQSHGESVERAEVFENSVLAVARRCFPESDHSRYSLPENPSPTFYCNPITLLN